jgi:hypothetical protein
LFRDAAIAGLIETSPCILTHQQLGRIRDKDPEWRAQALFTREEAERLISDVRIPADRRLVYAFGLLAGLRSGEIDPTRSRAARRSTATTAVRTGSRPAARSPSSSSPGPLLPSSQYPTMSPSYWAPHSIGPTNPFSRRFRKRRGPGEQTGIRAEGLVNSPG